MNDILNDFVLAIKNKTNAKDGDQLKIVIDHLELNHPISTSKITLNQATNPIADLAEHCLINKVTGETADRWHCIK